MSITINNKVTSTSSIDTWKILMSNSSKLRLKKPHGTQCLFLMAMICSLRGNCFLIQHWTRIVLGGSKDSQRPENRLGWIVLLPSSWGSRIGFKDWLKDCKILPTGKATKQLGTKQFHYWEELSPIALKPPLNTTRAIVREFGRASSCSSVSINNNQFITWESMGIIS